MSARAQEDVAAATDVEIREVGLRDGLQLEDPIPLKSKLSLLEALVATGIRRIEATSFVSPTAVPALADAEDVAAELRRWPDVEFSALVAGFGGAKRALAAGVRRLEYVVSVSNSHSVANVGRTTEQSLELVRPIADLCADGDAELEVILATAWDCPFEGRIRPQDAVAGAKRALDDGASALCLGDTIGTVAPGRTTELIREVRDVTRERPLGIHLHNTYGSGLASAWAAWEVGIRRFDASFGGLGGCPFAPGATGNIATEELVYLFEESGIATGISLASVVDAVGLLRSEVGHELSSNLFKARLAKARFGTAHQESAE